jgi:hypothetical protein
MLDVNFFDELRIGLASAGNIREWSFGEVKKPTEPSSQKKMVSLMKRSSDQLVTGNAIAVSTSAYASKELSASDAASKLPVQKFVVSVWATSNLQLQ